MSYVSDGFFAFPPSFPINNVFSSFLLLFLFPAIKYFQKQKGMIIL